jgi:hypothetical protein
MKKDEKVVVASPAYKQLSWTASDGSTMVVGKTEKGELSWDFTGTDPNLITQELVRELFELWK